jgi:hypothetical protein
MRYILTRELTALSSNPNPARHESAVEIAAAAPGKAQSNVNNINKNSKPASSKPSSTALALPRPISPIAAREADGDTFCAEGAWFQKYVVKSSVTKDGWQWFDETTPINLKYCDHFNCHRLGYKANGALKSLDIMVRQRPHLSLATPLVVIFSPGALCRTLTTSACAPAALQLQVNTNNVTSVSRLEKRALVIFFTRSPLQDTMGIARVSCVSGCSCTPIELDGYNDDFYATLGAGSTEVGVKIGVNLV